MKKIIQTAIVGFGLSGKAFHAPFLHVHDGFSIKKILERHGTEAQEAYPQAEQVKDLDSILSDDTIELVVIATPNAFHCEQVKKCLEAGKHVVVEKPFMNSSADCDKIIELAESKGLQLFVFQNRRWDGDFMTVQKIVDCGVLGTIQYYEAHFDRYAPKRTHAAWRDIDQPGSGIVFDLGSHLIDQALVLFGKPDTIESHIESQREGSAVDDYFNIQLKYPALEVVLTAGMLVKEHDLRYVLHGSNGSFIKYGIDPQESLLRKGKLPNGNGWGREDPNNYGLITLDDENEDFDGVLETVPGNYSGFYENVYDVLVKSSEKAVKPREARSVIRLIELALESSKLSKPLPVDY